MDDPEIRERLIAYVSAEPPRTLTADAIVRAGRRARRVSRLRVGSTVVVLVAAAAVVPAVLGPRAAGPDEPAGIVLNPDGVCAATATPPRAVRDADGFPPYDGTAAVDADADVLIDHTAARLRCAVTDLVTSRLPGFRYHQIGDADTPPAQTLAPLAFYVDVKQQRFAATAVVVDDHGAVAVGFTVIRSGIDRDPDVSRAIGLNCTDRSCRHTTGRRGEPVTYRATDTSLDVIVDFGRTVVHAWMVAQDLRHWRSQPTAPPRTELPLTIEQLIEIATDPRLDVFAQP